MIPPCELRPLTRADLPLLSGWLQEPLVQRWWADDPAPAALEHQYGGSIDGTDPTRVLVASHDGAPFGLVQWYRYADEAEYAAELAAEVDLPAGAVGIDYLVGDPAARGRGLADAMVEAALADAAAAGAQTVVVAVHAANRASSRLLERCGFRLVGDADLDPDNPEDDRRHLVHRRDLPPPRWTAS